MPPALAVAALVTVANLLIMGGEAILSAFNEKVLRARGAVEPDGDVIHIMRWVYPGAFILMGVEGALTGPAPKTLLMVGLAIFGLAKALKVWAISSLGWRWSYRVLVLPGQPLVSTGPYRFLPHPNYLAVVGEMIVNEGAEQRHFRAVAPAVVHAGEDDVFRRVLRGRYVVYGLTTLNGVRDLTNATWVSLVTNTLGDDGP